MGVAPLLSEAWESAPPILGCTPVDGMTLLQYTEII